MKRILAYLIVASLGLMLCSFQVISDVTVANGEAIEETGSWFSGLFHGLFSIGIWEASKYVSLIILAILLLESYVLIKRRIKKRLKMEGIDIQTIDTIESLSDKSDEEEAAEEEEKLFYCRKCGTPLHSYALSCKHCGEQDPLRFNKARKLRKIRDIFIITSWIGIIAFMYFADLIPRDWPDGIFPLVGILGYFAYALVIVMVSNVFNLLWILWKEEKEMAQVYKDMGRIEEYDDWYKALIDIL